MYNLLILNVIYENDLAKDFKIFPSFVSERSNIHPRKSDQKPMRVNTYKLAQIVVLVKESMLLCDFHAVILLANPRQTLALE